MRIGIPKELHDGEKRVATTPEVAGFLVARGVERRGELAKLLSFG